MIKMQQYEWSENMKNQEEFEIIRIEKNLEREKKLAVATSTLYAISSVLTINVKEHNYEFRRTSNRVHQTRNTSVLC